MTYFNFTVNKEKIFYYVDYGINHTEKFLERHNIKNRTADVVNYVFENVLETMNPHYSVLSAAVSGLEGSRALQGRVNPQSGIRFWFNAFVSGGALTASYIIEPEKILPNAFIGSLVAFSSMAYSYRNIANELLKISGKKTI